ncbi:unnamed protein product, partial [Adineta ricciae]
MDNSFMLLKAFAKLCENILNELYTRELFRKVFPPQQANNFRSIAYQNHPILASSPNGNQDSSSQFNSNRSSFITASNAQTIGLIDNQQSEEYRMLCQKAEQHRNDNAELLAGFERLNEEMKAKKITSFEVLAEQDKRAAKLFLELARLTEPMPLDNINIGIFGLTSTGKSTLLNSLLGKKVAETGPNETTTKITSYPGTSYTLWDVPGRNDETVYIN